MSDHDSSDTENDDFDWNQAMKDANKESWIAEKVELKLKASKSLVPKKPQLTQLQTAVKFHRLKLTGKQTKATLVSSLREFYTSRDFQQRQEVKAARILAEELDRSSELCKCGKPLSSCPCDISDIDSDYENEWKSGDEWMEHAKENAKLLALATIELEFEGGKATGSDIKVATALQDIEQLSGESLEQLVAATTTESASNPGTTEATQDPSLKTNHVLWRLPPPRLISPSLPLLRLTRRLPPSRILSPSLPLPPSRLTPPPPPRLA